MPRDELAEALWGDTPPATWEKALTVLVSKLRALITESGLDGATVLTGAFGCYRLALPEAASVDVVAAAEAVHEAEAALAAGELEDSKVLASRAAAVARRPFLPGEDGTWAEAKRRELVDVLRRALNCLAETSLLTDQAEEAAKLAEEAIALEPYRETGYRHLMRAHAAAGNRAEALRVYERCRRLLAEELGAYPSPETESIYRQLLAEPAPRTSVAAVFPKARERGKTIALSRRVLVAAGAATILVGVAAATGLLTTRGERSSETFVKANAVGLVDAHGHVRGEVAVDAAPTSVAFGHGAVWVTNASANTVSRIDPQTRSVRQTIPVGSSPSGVAVTTGAVWVANHDDGTVSWINPQSNTVVGELRVGNAPIAVAAGFGSVWVTNSGDRTVSRIDADSASAVTIPTGAVGRGIAIGGGAVWVTDEATRTVLRVDPATNRVTNTAAVGSGPAGIVYGDGAVWVANELDGTVSEVDAETLAVRATIPVAGGPAALAFDDGGLWVSAEFGQRVVRIDTDTLKETAALHVGNRPKGLTVVPGGVWVAVQASGTGHRGGRLVVLGDEFDSIDPGLANSSDSFTLIGVAYDGLTAFRRVGGSEGTQLVANLAAALPLPTDGGRSYTFRVRKGIRYSDGSPLQAQDFKRALERMIALDAPMLQGSPLSKIVGSSACIAGRPCDLSRGVVVRGASSLTFRLSRPDARLPLFLTTLVPIPAGTPSREIGAKPVPSTGPYAIERYVPRRQLVLVRNSHFRTRSERARPAGYPDEIVWRLGLRPEEALRQVADGRADILLNGVPADRVAELAARYPRRLHLIPQRATAFVFLNTRRPPFDDVLVRRALNYAVDRAKLVELHGGSAVAEPTCQAVPPSVPGYRRYCPYTIDPDSSGDWKAPDFAKARRLIAASGTEGAEVVVWTFPFFAEEGRYFTSLLRRLGYRAQLREFRAVEPYFTSLNRTPHVQAGLAGWFGFQLAADTFGTLRCGLETNWAHFCDSGFDRDVERLAALQANDPGAGAALAARLDRRIVDQAPWVPLFTPRFADFTSKRVGNYQGNTYASSSVLLDQLWVR